MGNGLPYFGRKNEENCAVTAQLLPDIDIRRIIDCCMGSGNFSRYISCQMMGVEKIAFELERSLYTLHMVIKDENKLEELLEMMKEVPNTEEFYKQCELIVKSYNEGKTQYTDIDVALAELVFICFSMNSQRNRRRNTLSYMKYDDEIKRNQKRIELEAIVSKFYNRLPSDLQDMHFDWADLDIRYESFIDNMDLWEDENTFVYADVPYMLDKRGRGKKDNPKSKAGYLMDWSFDDHVKFIDKVIEMKKAGKLKSKVMVCSNFEIDNEGYLVDIANDPYTELLKNGFRLVVTEHKYTCAPSQDKGEDKKKTKKKKVEVLYLSYIDIICSWDNFEYYDYEDVIKGNVKIRNM